MGWLVLEVIQKDLAFKHIGMFADNTSSVSWAKKGSTTTSIPAARLLRFLSLRQRARQASSIIPLHICGEDNKMADISSRAFKHGEYFVAHSHLVPYFNAHFPLPQPKSWQEFKVPKKLSWRVISCLLGEQLPMESLIRLPKVGTNIGANGVRTSPLVTLPPPLQKNHPSNKPSSSLASLNGSGQVLTAEEIKSRFSPSIKHSQPSPRPWNWVANKVPPSKVRETTLLPCTNNWKDSAGKTHHPSHN